METIKEEKKTDLEQLLNSLIEKGWIPRWKNVELYWTSKNTFWEQIVIFIGNAGWFKKWWWTYRELVSKESWLWQFVCDREHRLINKRNYDGVSLDKRLKNPYADYGGVDTEYEWITGLDYQYRLIESSLKDESELEDFLLSNIVIKDE